MFNTGNNVNQTAESIGASSANELNDRKSELTQEDFFALLTTQLAQQDPFKPLDNTEFVAQMAQFSSLESLQAMQDSFSSLANAMTSNQALQASALVGRTVLVPSDVAAYDGSTPIEGIAAASEAGSNGVLRIEDEAGQLIRTIELGEMQPGSNAFVWDGKNEAGVQMPEGYYRMRVSADVYGQETAIATGVYARVDSVNLGGGQGGIFLNLDGLGSVSLDDVSQIKE